MPVPVCFPGWHRKEQAPFVVLPVFCNRALDCDADGIDETCPVLNLVLSLLWLFDYPLISGWFKILLLQGFYFIP